MAKDEIKNRLLKKIKLLAEHQKMMRFLEKEEDKFEEFSAKEKDREKITSLKQKLKK